LSLLDRIDPASARGVPRRLIWMLGLGAFALAWSLTTVAAYLPPVLGRFTDSQTLIGGVLGAEGAFALALPLLVGPLSDRARVAFGRRRIFMLAALPPLVAALALLGSMPTLGLTIAVTAVFFVAYYVFEPPYRSLYPDRLDDRALGRSQSVQHLERGAALGLALVLGGVLYGLWRGLPFVVAALVVAVSAGVLVAWVHEGEHAEESPSLAAPFSILRRNPRVRLFLVANTAWELTFAGMRTFVVLYVTKGLGESVLVSSAVLGAVAVGYLIAAVVAGKLGERFGTARTILVAGAVYGVGLCGGGLPHAWHWVYLAVIAVVAIAAGIVMTLAWALLFELAGDADHASIAGLATTTKGLGLVLGPVLAGLAIDQSRGWLAATHGYQALWPTVGVPILLSLPVVAKLARAGA
jgi:MFS family permease